MTIQIAGIVRRATDYNGKLNLLGTFDTGSDEPVAGGSSVMLDCVAPRVQPDRGGGAQGENEFVDDMPSIEMPIDVAVLADANFLLRNFIINIQQLKFDQPGQDAIDVAD
jgi:hypothetical protein